MLASTEACSPVDHDNIAFTMSTDGGNTWSSPIKVNKTPMTEPNFGQQAFTPSMHVSAGGTVAVTYYDLRNNTPDPPGARYGLLRRELRIRNGGLCQSRQAGKRRRDHASSVQHPQGAVCSRLLPRRLHGPRHRQAADFAALFGQAFTQNDANQYFSRLSPGRRGSTRAAPRGSGGSGRCMRRTRGQFSPPASSSRSLDPRASRHVIVPRLRGISPVWLNRPQLCHSRS